MKSWHFLLFLLVSTVIGVPDEDVKDANEYMDLLLDNLRKDPVIARKVEPIHVPDVRERSFEGRNIYVQGLSYLTRLNDCKVKTEDGKVYINCQLGVTKMKFKMDYKVKGGLLPLWIGGKANGKIDHVTVDCTVTVSSFDGIGALEKFEVTHFGGFRVTKVRGATVALNWLITIITNTMFNHSKKMVIEGIENGVSKLLQEKLSEVKISSRRLKPKE